MTIRLSKAFGSTPETWLGMQMAYDLWQARGRAEQIKVKRLARDAGLNAAVGVAESMRVPVNDEMKLSSRLAETREHFVVLSTFQPTVGDPVEGFWRAFVQYGKLAPELHANSVFKRQQVMLEPGASFRTDSAPRPFYGRPIRPDRLLKYACARIPGCRRCASRANRLRAGRTLAVPHHLTRADI